MNNTSAFSADRSGHMAKLEQTKSLSKTNYLPITLSKGPTRYTLLTITLEQGAYRFFKIYLRPFLRHFKTNFSEI